MKEWLSGSMNEDQTKVIVHKHTLVGESHTMKELTEQEVKEWPTMICEDCGNEYSVVIVDGQHFINPHDCK